MLNFGFYASLTLFIIICLFLILLILIQKGRGGGLASAFGGAGGNTAFGSKTGDVLTWATSIVFGIFLILAVSMNLISNRMDKNHRDDLAKLNSDTTSGVDPAAPPVETELPAPAPQPQPQPAPAPAPAAADKPATSAPAATAPASGPSAPKPSSPTTTTAPSPASKPSPK